MSETERQLLGEWEQEHKDLQKQCAELEAGMALLRRKLGVEPKAPAQNGSELNVPTRILSLLEGNPSIHTIPEVIAAMPDVDQKLVRSTLVRLAAAGKIAKPERGKYKSLRVDLKDAVSLKDEIETELTPG